MTAQVALLRGVNVGGRKVVMAELRAFLEREGYSRVRTLIASGNLVLDAKEKAAKLELALESQIAKGLGLVTDVFVRSGAELDAIIAANPFADFAKKDPSHLLIMFLKAKLTAAEVKAVEAPHAGPEQARVVGREIFITYPEGIGPSKFKLALKQKGTGRNLNTVRKLAEMARGE